MTFSMTNFYPCFYISPHNTEILLYKITFSLETHCFRRHTGTCTTAYKVFTPLEYGVLLAKISVKDQNWRGLGYGSIQKVGSLFILATAEASNFKFGTQLGFRTRLPKKRLGSTLVGVWATGASENGTHIYFCNR